MKNDLMLRIVDERFYPLLNTQLGFSFRVWYFMEAYILSTMILTIFHCLQELNLRLLLSKACMQVKDFFRT